MIWFIKTSYRYINPNGIIGHFKFLKDLPKAWSNFKEHQNDNTN